MAKTTVATNTKYYFFYRKELLGCYSTKLRTYLPISGLVSEDTMTMEQSLINIWYRAEAGTNVSFDAFLSDVMIIPSKLSIEEFKKYWETEQTINSLVDKPASKTK